jgi:hypothetical protein
MSAHGSRVRRQVGRLAQFVVAGHYPLCGDGRSTSDTEDVRAHLHDLFGATERTDEFEFGCTLSLCARSVCAPQRNCDHRPVQIIAVDWSGRAKGPAESLWRAEVRDGRLTELRNGLDRGELSAKLLELGEAEPSMVIGLDFAFSFPAWWCEENGWSSGEDVWSAMGHEGEDLLEGCESPFWGRPGKRNPHPKARLYRQTERSKDAVRPKSVFQIGGAGAVGTGSIRGMPHLLTLAKNGFGIWPFSEGWPRVVEIYPRALTGPVNKGRWSARHDYLLEHFPEQPRDLLERAAGSEDAFDAAVSALVMSEHEAELRALGPPADPADRVEGKIWRPQ